MRLYRPETRGEKAKLGDVPVQVIVVKITGFWHGLAFGPTSTKIKNPVPTMPHAYSPCPFSPLMPVGICVLSRDTTALCWIGTRPADCNWMGFQGHLMPSDMAFPLFAFFRRFGPFLVSLDRFWLFYLCLAIVAQVRSVWLFPIILVSTGHFEDNLPRGLNYLLFIWVLFCALFVVTKFVCILVSKNWGVLNTLHYSTLHSQASL